MLAFFSWVRVVVDVCLMFCLLRFPFGRLRKVESGQGLEIYKLSVLLPR